MDSASSLALNSWVEGKAKGIAIVFFCTLVLSLGVRRHTPSFLHPFIVASAICVNLEILIIFIHLYLFVYTIYPLDGSRNDL